MKLLPTGDRVAVLPVNQEEKIGNISIARDHKNQEMQFGEIVAAGPESLIKEGSKVLYNPAAGTMLRRLKDNGEYEELRIMHFDSIQCVFE